MNFAISKASPFVRDKRWLANPSGASEFLSIQPPIKFAALQITALQASASIPASEPEDASQQYSK
jgi:hypothetical protein